MRRHTIIYDSVERIANRGARAGGFAAAARRNGGKTQNFRYGARERNYAFKARFFFAFVSDFHRGRKSGTAAQNGGKNFSERVERE